jgi:hypothetical protein
MTWASNGVNPGSGTLEWTYSNINPSEFDELWWTPQQLGVGLSGSPDDQLFSNLSGSGIATYAGITTWLDPNSGSPGHVDNVNTRIIVEILGHSLTNTVPAEITSANLTPGTFAFALDVSGLTEFTATFRAEAQNPHTGTWMAVNDFNQFPSPGSQTSTSVGGMFFRSAPIAETPAPATVALLGLGFAGLGWTRRRKANANRFG